MKKIFLAAGLLLCITTVFAQKAPATYTGDDAGTGTGFRRENIFFGGSLGLGFASNTFNAGANPEVGYSFAQWLDAGVAINLNYTSERADPYYNGNVRYRSFNYGAGVFTRIYPVNFLFIQLQPEENWIHYNTKDFYNDITLNNTTNAFSFIAGVGYTQRVVGQGSYFLMVGLDLANNVNSPYHGYNNVQVPIIRAGFDFYLKPRKNK